MANQLKDLLRQKGPLKLVVLSLGITLFLNLILPFPVLLIFLAIPFLFWRREEKR